MKKNVSLALSFIVLTGLTNSINAEKSNLEKLLIGIGVATIAGGSNYAKEMNDEYSRINKDPDLKMRCTKAALAVGTIVGIELLTGPDNSTVRNVAKVGALLVALTATTETIAEIIRPLPLIGGLLTDPVDRNGKEKKDFGAIARFAITYIPLRAIALNFCPDGVKKK